MMDFLRRYGIRIIGAVVFFMSVLSVLITASYNRTQAQYVRCGGVAVQQTIDAIQTRDKAAIDLAAASKRLIHTRYAVILLLAHAPEAPKVSLPDALADYEDAARGNETAIDNYVAAIRAAPLPTAGCLNRVR
jgi:hypothetical protein